MADGHLGSRATSSWPITKIFTAFRIALDIKKLALAAAGIFATWLGWWILCWVFYTPVERRPQWKNFQGEQSTDATSWRKFKIARARWNLLHKLAGPPTNDPKEAVRQDAADVASSLDEFKLFEAVLEGRQPLAIDVAKAQLMFGGAAVATFKANDADLDALKALGAVPLVDVVIVEGDKGEVVIAGKTLTIATDFDKFRARRDAVKLLTALSDSSRKTLEEHLKKPVYLPAGVFRISPWSEDRGPNPYLLVSNFVTRDKTSIARGEFFAWLLNDQLPVLVEPIIKFVSPIYFLLQRDAGGWQNWFLLVFIIFWNIAVWGYFGGAICRLAAVQFARNEKIPLSEAIAFVNHRCKHFFLAPVFPLVCLLVLMIALGLFGFVTGWTHFFGDIVVAGLMWPVVIVLGLIMAVLLVGLFAWPLMYPTIAVEGSDSFDALSRSYSYLYQAPWNFLGYIGTALVYGAALVFFVGFMGSLMVSIGQWGFSGVPGLASEDATKDRTPAYFFANAPTSFGWRDLFLQDSPWADEVTVAPIAVGTAPVQYELKDKYAQAISWNNSVGGWLVTFWLGLTFLLVVGFGYSYFWTAATIIYFLMRKKVDDTEFDEIYLEEDESPPPPPPPVKEPAPAPAPKPGTLSLNVVEPPPAPPV